MAERLCTYSESSPIVSEKTTNGHLQQFQYGNNSKEKPRECILGTLNHLELWDEATNQPAQTDDSEMDAKKSFNFSKIPRDKKIVMCISFLANFLSATAYTVLGPYFPLVAEEKGLNQTMVGFIFGVFQLVVFLTSPFMGNFMVRVGVKFMFLSGIFIGGCCAILFGLLDKGPDGTIFLVMCILVRSIEAFGFSAFMTASMTIVSSEFQDHAGSVLVVLKVATGLGSLIGPFLGGILYDVSGFGLPFFVVAAATLLNGLISYKFLPAMHSEKSCQKREKSILDLLRSPLVVISMITVFVGLCGIHFFLSTFSHFLQPFGLSTSLVGAMFIIGPVIHMCMSPLWGYIVDVKDSQSILIISSFLASCFGWWLLGHSPLLPIEPFTLWSIGIGYFIIGMCIGCLVIPPMKCMVYGAFELKFEKDPDTFAMVSGLLNSVYSLGAGLGPLIGGVLVQRYGHPYVFTGIGCLNLLMFLVTLLFFSFRYFNARKESHN